MILSDRFRGHAIIQRQITQNGTSQSYIYNGGPIERQLSNGAIFNDFEQPITQFSRSRHFGR